MFAGIVRSAKTAAATLIAGAVVIGGAFAIPAEDTGEVAVGGLSEKYQSAEVEQLLEDFPDAQDASALIVISRADGGELSQEDLGTVAEITTAATEFGVEAPPAQAPPLVSENELVAMVPVTLQATTDDSNAVEEEVADLREVIADASGEDLTAELTGGAAFSADLAGVFAGANFTLLLFTALIVAVLLIVTYRSPWLWLVPLAIVATIEQLALHVVELLEPVTGIGVDPSAVGITSVLVFGAATNYALLLIARYREELRRNDSVYEAMGIALTRTREAIIASGGTVVLALLTLLFTDTLSYRGLGFSAATGVVLAMAGALFLLPAAMVLFGRRLFWPFVPKVGDPSREGKFWGRLGEATFKRPKIIAGSALVVLIAMGAALFNVQIGLSENEQFTEKPQAVTAAETLAEGFPAGSTTPLTVLVDSGSVDTAVGDLQSVDGVDSVSPGSEHDGRTQLSVITGYEAGTDEANAQIKEMREVLADGEYGGLVGGEAAERVDQLAANQHDMTLVVSAVVILIFLVLVALLRALVAPVLLVVTVLLTNFSAAGLSWLLFKYVLDFPAMDTLTLLYAFLFLSALGVDYNIFLVTRAKENARTMGTPQGMLSALRSTGGVITSAGILLAAVFVVLGVLPLVTLTQVGILVAIGVLLDTLVVRTVIVPALTFLLGEKFWWPSNPAGKHGRHSSEQAESEEDPAGERETAGQGGVTRG